MPQGVQLTNDQLTGTPTDVRTASVTLRATDDFGFQITRDFTLRVAQEPLPALQITGVGDRINPGQQSPFGIDMSATYVADITGQLTFDFSGEPDVAGVDPALQFNSGGRVASFRIPVGQTRGVFTASTLQLQTGTVAGAINFRIPLLQVVGLTVSPTNRPNRIVRINQLAPVLNNATVDRITGGFNITVDGFSTTREITEAVLTLTPAAGRELQSTRIVVPLVDRFKEWFSNPSSFAFGTQFRLVMPFTGDPTAITSATLKLRNSIGESEKRTIRF